MSGGPPSRDPGVFTRPGSASVRPAALYDAVYELALGGGGGGGGLTEAEVQALIDASLIGYQALAQEGQPNGYAPLDAGGLIPNAHLPALAITDTFVCSSQAQMLALNCQVGDVAVRTDLNVTFILAAAPPSVAANWQQILAPTGGGGAVISVNGYTGVVNLVAADVGALTQAAADARYSLTSHLHAGVYATPTDVSTAVANHAAAADPHATYLNTTRGDARYLQPGTAASTYVPLAGGSVMTGLLGPSTTNTRDLGTTALRWRKLWGVDADFTNAPTVGGSALLTQSAGDARYSLTAHNHAGVYATPGDVSSAISTHEAAADPHAVYLTPARGDARYSLTSHTHAGVYATPADVTNAVNAHAAAGDPHTVYLTTGRGDARYSPLAHNHDAAYLKLAGGAVTGPLTVQGLLVALDPAPDNTLTWTAAGLKSVASGTGGGDLATLHREEFEGPTGSAVTLAGVPDTLLTVARNGVEQANGGLHFSQAGNVLTFSDPFAAGERVVVTYASGDAVAAQATVDVVITGDQVIAAAEAPANTFALAFKRSASAGNALAVNADGLYAPTVDLAGHVAAADPHAVYYNQARGDARYALTGHNHDAAYAALAHNHASLYLPLAGGSVLTGTTGPTTTNAIDLGTTALRWRKLWAVDGEFTNPPTVGGASMDTRYQLATAHPKISVQSAAPSSPATGDLWIW